MSQFRKKKGYLAYSRLIQPSKQFLTGLFIAWNLNSSLSVMLKWFHKINAKYSSQVKMIFKYCLVVPNNSFFGPHSACFISVKSLFFFNLFLISLRDKCVFSQLQNMIFLLPAPRVGTESFLCCNFRRSLKVSGYDTVVCTNWT